MNDAHNWRTEVDAGDYFSHQKKQLNVADRRPVIRRPSDLVGPGLSATAVQITNFNDTLALYNGFFSASPGAAEAPNSTDSFAGVVVSDSGLGGTQTFTSLNTRVVYRRTFVRNPADPSAVYWSPWEDTRPTPLYSGGTFVSMADVAVGGTAVSTIEFPVEFSVAPAAWAIKSGFVSGSSTSSITAVDNVTTTGCRIVVTNLGTAAATFSNLPIRWFAQLALG